jgi:hypothetical protein
MTKQIRTITAVGPTGLQCLSTEDLLAFGEYLTYRIAEAQINGQSELLDDYCIAKRDLNKELGRRCKIS